MRENLKNLCAYVPEATLDEVKKKYDLKKVYRLSANENPYGTSKKVEEAVKNWNFSESNRYPDGYAQKLRTSIAKHIGCKESQLILGVGLDEIIAILSRTFLDQGDEVIVSDPTFSEYELNALIEGAVVKHAKCSEETGKTDFEAMLSEMTDKTKMIWICNPNNPTGALNPVEEIDAFLAKVPKDVIVLIDEAYIEFADGNQTAVGLLSKYDNAAVMRTFSKIYGLANYRVGYIVMSSEPGNVLQTVRCPYNLNSLSQTAALAALSDQEFVEKCARKNALEREKLEKFFEENDIFYFKSQANFVFFKFEDAEKLAEYLLKHGYQVRRGLRKDWLRVTIGKKKENAELMRLILQYHNEKRKQ